MRAGRPIRVLFFTGATSWGGAEIVVGHIICGLGARFEPILIGVDEEVVHRLVARRPDMSWMLIPRVRHRRDIRNAWAQRRALVGAQADIVHINLPVPSAEPLTILAALTIPQLRVVLVEHLPMAIRSAKVRLLRRMAAPRVAADVAVGGRTARELEQLIGLPAGSVRVVPNGVPAQVAAVARRRGAEFVIGAVGRLHHQKGFDVLIRAVAQIPGSQLVLVGDGPDRASLERLAENLGVGTQLTVVGWTDSVSARLADFDVVAAPSRFEGLPLALLEAMMSRRPIVASNVGSIPDVLQDGYNGLLVPVDDSTALARALRRLRDDPELAARLASTAADLAQRLYTASRMVAGYEKIYDEIVRPLSARRQRRGLHRRRRIRDDHAVDDVPS